MRVLHIASEAALIAKVGGLGDVLTGLGRELVTQKIDSSILLPRYGCMDFSHLTPTGRKEVFQTNVGGTSRSASVELFLLQDTIPVWLLDAEDGFWSGRKAIYGYQDEVFSFLAFSKMAFDWLQSCPKRFSIVHLHDWQAAFVAPLIRYHWNEMSSLPKTVLTLHNMEYQGKCAFDQLSFCSSDVWHRCPQGLFDDPKDGCANLLKAAILSVDLITTVSETYAREILTLEGGKGLSEPLNMRREDLSGIVNGLDIEHWDPARDRYFIEHYSSQDSIQKIRAAKRAIKQGLFQEIGLDLARIDEPLIAAVTRLVPQKGLGLLHHVFSNLHDFDSAGILLGSAFDHETTQRFSELDSHLLSHKRGRALLQFQEGLAHRIFAASDIILVPSLFEPCGLTQLLAQRYGSIPIVRRTGGLADTVTDYHDKRAVRAGPGFVFDHPENHVMHHTLSRALNLYRNAPAEWNTIIHEAMRLDLGWSQPSKKYIELYRRLL